jgi:anti-sigma regulatory factor (Ser/Thr protein kinase)
MTNPKAPVPQRIAAFAVPSEPGNERLALARVAEAVAGLGLTTARLERLKTAVAEAAMNAIEHGNHNRAEIPVEVEVLHSGTEIVIAISDSGGGPAPAADDQEKPDLARKLEGQQSPRGWGLFLIRNMVDDMDVTTEGARHTVTLTMRTDAPEAEGAGHDEHV